MNTNQNREFVRLWTANSQRVFAYTLSLVPNRADAEEIFQETALDVWEKFDTFEPDTNFRAWACRFAFNKVRNYRQLRRHAAEKLSDRFAELIDETVHEQAPLLDAQSQALALCLEKLDPGDRGLVQRRYQDGNSVAAIAEAIGRSAATVYRSLTRIHRALLQCVTASVRKEGIK